MGWETKWSKTILFYPEIGRDRVSYLSATHLTLTKHCTCAQKWVSHAGAGPPGPIRTARTPTAKSCLGNNIWEASGKHLGCSKELGGQGVCVCVGLERKWSKNIMFFCICWRDLVF